MSGALHGDGHFRRCYDTKSRTLMLRFVWLNCFLIRKSAAVRYHAAIVLSRNLPFLGLGLSHLHIETLLETLVNGGVATSNTPT